MNEVSFNDINSSIKCKNDRKGVLKIRVYTEHPKGDLIIKKQDKPEFINFLKDLIKELQK